jgi:hypothetical protein
MYMIMMMIMIVIIITIMIMIVVVIIIIMGLQVGPFPDLYEWLAEELGGAPGLTSGHGSPGVVTYCTAAVSRGQSPDTFPAPRRPSSLPTKNDRPRLNAHATRPIVVAAVQVI